MSLTSLLSLQLLAHLLTDYILQPDKKAKEKNQLGFKSSYLKWHIAITFATSWLLSMQWQFVGASAAIAFSHWLIDGIKPRLANVQALMKYTYFIDQLLHVFTLSAFTFIHFKLLGGTNVFTDQQVVWFLLAFTACAKPANILIKELFALFDVSIKTNGGVAELPNAGKLIGLLERWLVLVFIASSHFDAIGFLIAAKSILRFKDTDTLRTEYVLIGTMLSFGIAVALGLILLDVN